VGGTTLGFSGPSASNAQGDVYVVDALADRVVELGPTGHLLRQFGSPGSGPGQFHFQYQAGSSGSQSGGIAVNARTGDVYVADTWNERIEEFTGQGVFVRAWGRGVPAGATRLREGEFYGPRGLAIGPGGDVYVADTGNRRIQVFTATGRFRFAFGTAGNGPGQFEEPSSVAIDPAGHVYVADFWNRRIQVFTRQGRLVGQVGVPAWQRGSYAEPVVAVRGKRVYVPDPVGGRVLVYSTTGQPLVALGGLGSQPLSVSVSPTGHLLVSMGSSARLLLLAP
jgi:DNA-binding beta-propeller fold protein YncE